MDAEGANNLELKKKDSHHSEETEKIEKVESDKNSVDIQSASSKPENKEEKNENIEKSEKSEKIDKSPSEKKQESCENLEKNEEKQEKNLEEEPKVQEKSIENQRNEEKSAEEEVKNSENALKTTENGAINEKSSEETKEIFPNPTEISSKPEKIIEKMPENTTNIFKAIANVKKSELSSEEAAKTKKNKKKKLLSEEETQVLNQKKARFCVIKHWDNERSKALNQQITLVDKLLIKLDQKIRSSTASWLNIMQFFKEKAAFEKEYLKSFNKLPKGANKTEQKSASSRKKSQNIAENEEVFGIEKFLEEIDNANANKAKNLNNFCVFIENGLIEKKIKGQLEIFEKEIATNKKNIENLKKNLCEMNLLTAQKAKNYSKLYSEMINDEDFENNAKKDLFLHELSFVTTARKQSRTIKDLLIEVMKFIQIFIKFEKDKQKTLKEVFEEFLNQYIFAHGPDVFVEFLQKIKLIEESDLQKIYSLQSFLVNNEDLAVFCKEFASHEEFLNFLQNEYKIIELPEEHCLLKAKFKASVKTHQTYDPTWVLFTVDKNLIFAKKDENYEEISFDNSNICVKIDQGITVYQKDLVLEITQNISGLIFNTKKITAIRCEDEKNVGEIVALLNKKI